MNNQKKTQQEGQNENIVSTVDPSQNRIYNKCYLTEGGTVNKLDLTSNKYSNIVITERTETCIHISIVNMQQHLNKSVDDNTVRNIATVNKTYYYYQ